jgi:hypothetical protein
LSEFLWARFVTPHLPLFFAVKKKKKKKKKKGKRFKDEATVEVLKILKLFPKGRGGGGSTSQNLPQRKNTREFSASFIFYPLRFLVRVECMLEYEMGGIDIKFLANSVTTFATDTNLNLCLSFLSCLDGPRLDRHIPQPILHAHEPILSGSAGRDKIHFSSCDITSVCIFKNIQPMR